MHNALCTTHCFCKELNDNHKRIEGSIYNARENDVQQTWFQMPTNLIQHPGLEVWQPLEASASVDEDLVLQEGGKAAAVEGHPEVLRLRPQLGHDVVVKLRHRRQQLGQLRILKRLLLVLRRKLFANLVKTNRT